MSGVNKHGSWEYSGGIPLPVGDLYFTPDRVRDFLHLLDQMGKIAFGETWLVPAVLKGCAVSHGAGDTLNIAAGLGLTYFNVDIPDSFASLPPSVTTADMIRLIEMAAQTNLAIPSATLDGMTVNYVKVRYAETNGNTRARQYAGGSYAYERIPSFTITVSPSSPDATYDLVLASFTGSSGGAFVITNADNFYPLHRNLSGEIAGLSENAAPGSADLTIVESGAGLKKKSSLANLFMQSYLSDTGILLAYKTVSSTGIAMEGYIYKPILCWFKMVAPSGTGYWYGLQLNPGHYKIDMGGADTLLLAYQNGGWKTIAITTGYTGVGGFEVSLYLTGVYGIDSIADLTRISSVWT